MVGAGSNMPALSLWRQTPVWVSGSTAALDRVLCPGFLKTKSENEPGNTFVGTGELLQSRGNSQVGWARMFGGGVAVCEGTRGQKLKQKSSPEESGDTNTVQADRDEWQRVAMGILAGKNLGTEVDGLPGWH